MREWLKDHALEIASLVVAVVGVRGLTDFWARLQEMFSSYSTEALFSCGLAAAAAAIVATYFARSGYRRRIAAKDAEIASLEGQLQMAKVPGAVAGLKAMAAAASASTSAPGGDPLAALVPAEVALLLRVYDSGTVRLDDSTLPVARSLAEKGAIYRRDTHDSGVILDCDVMLSGDWVPVVRERADELRGARGEGASSLEAELAGRPAQEDVGELKRQLAAKDAEIESLRSPVESVRRTMASLPEDERALAGRLAEGPFRTSGFSAGLAHLESMGIAKRQRVPGVFTPTWALTREAMSALAEDDGLKATVADALGRGLRDREAEEAIASAIRRASAEAAGAISFMFDKGHFDYRAPDDDPWEARMDQGNRELSEMESYGVIQYETLASGERRWTLTESARRAIESDESLIGEGRAYVRAALGDGADEEGAGA